MGIINIQEVHTLDGATEALSEILIKTVDQGASIGFLPPLQEHVARDYWNGVLGSDVILLIAKSEGQIAGTVQVHLCNKQNGLHRAEIAKLMVHPEFRRMGIARLLMNEAEEKARSKERSLIVLDTREGDPSNDLYKSLGYIEAGRIPYFAESESGSLDTTVIYYKTLEK